MTYVPVTPEAHDPRCQRGPASITNPAPTLDVGNCARCRALAARIGVPADFIAALTDES